MSDYFYLNENKSIKNAFSIFNKSFGSIICVISVKKKLIGLLTEGDLRRAILRGFSVNEKINKIVNKNYTYVFKHELENKKFIKSKFNAQNLNESINFIPILNKNMQVISVAPTQSLLEKLEKKKNKKKIKKLAKILIVGGAGYIGTTLAKKLLNKNFEVVIVDKLLYDKTVIKKFLIKKKNFKFIHGDICDLNVQIDCIRDVDAVVFLAEIVGDPACNARPEDALKTNYLAVSSFANLCSILNISKFIYTSSCSVYGADYKNKILDETSRN